MAVPSGKTFLNRWQENMASIPLLTLFKMKLSPAYPGRQTSLNTSCTSRKTLAIKQQMRTAGSFDHLSNSFFISFHVSPVYQPHFLKKGEPSSQFFHRGTNTLRHPSFSDYVVIDEWACCECSGLYQKYCMTEHGWQQTCGQHTYRKRKMEKTKK